MTPVKFFLQIFFLIDFFSHDECWGYSIELLHTIPVDYYVKGEKKFLDTCERCEYPQPQLHVYRCNFMPVCVCAGTLSYFILFSSVSAFNPSTRQTRTERRKKNVFFLHWCTSNLSKVREREKNCVYLCTSSFWSLIPSPQWMWTVLFMLLALAKGISLMMNFFFSFFVTVTNTDAEIFVFVTLTRIHTPRQRKKKKKKRREAKT